jgi:hypothetical protein
MTYFDFMERQQTGSRPLYRDTDVVEFEETVEAVVLETLPPGAA